MVELPPIERIYGFKINMRVYGKESIEFLDRQGWVIGSIKHRDPIRIYRKILEELSWQIGKEEWKDRNQLMRDNIKRRENELKEREK